MTDWVRVVPETDDPVPEFERPAPVPAADGDDPPGCWPAVGVEIDVGRTVTWVARAARRRGLVAIEVEPVGGTTAVVGWLAGIWRRLGVKAVAVDPNSPASTLVEPLTKERLPVKEMGAHARARAHGQLQDALRAGVVRIKGGPAVGSAARVAQERRLSGSHALDRFAGDPAAVLAIENAYWGLVSVPRPAEPDVL